MFIAVHVWPEDTKTKENKIINDESTKIVYCLAFSSLIHLVCLLIKPGLYDLTVGEDQVHEHAEIEMVQQPGGVQNVSQNESSSFIQDASRSLISN